MTIRVAYSSVNYKDALAATGAGRSSGAFPASAVSIFPALSKEQRPAFQAGDQVIATSFDIGVAHHGGYAEIARVPGDWVVPLPERPYPFDAMALGTAGFTAALAIVRMEETVLRRTRASDRDRSDGGVGGLAIDMLAKLGYSVTALTGKNRRRIICGGRASEVMLRSSLDLSHIRPLAKAVWAGAVDNPGGGVLAWIASSMKPGERSPASDWQPVLH